MRRRSPWLALLAGIALALALTSSVSAYVGQVPTTITLTPFRGTVPCHHYYSVVATVLDQNGQPIKHLTVDFAITSSPSTHDKLKPTSDDTNKHGQAKVFIKYACVVGNRVITATVDGISASAVVFVKLRPKHHDDDDDDDNDHHDGDKKLSAAAFIDAVSLPSTSTLPGVALTSSATSSSNIPLVPAVIVLLAAAAIIIRRFVVSRR